MKVIFRFFLTCVLLLSTASPAFSSMEKAERSVLTNDTLQYLVGGLTEGTVGVKIINPSGYSELNNNETVSSSSYVVDINNLGAYNATNYSITVNGEQVASGSVLADTSSLVSGAIPPELHQSGEHIMNVDVWRSNDGSFRSRSTVQYRVP